MRSSVLSIGSVKGFQTRFANSTQKCKDHKDDFKNIFTSFLTKRREGVGVNTGSICDLRPPAEGCLPDLITVTWRLSHTMSHAKEKGCMSFRRRQTGYLKPPISAA